MTDQEMRELLCQIVCDIDAGRLRVRRPGRLALSIGAPLVAATLGLSGCSDRPVGVPRDAAVADARARDAETVDAGEQPDARPDAMVDAEIPLPYMAPPMADYYIWSEPGSGRGVV